MRTHTTGRKGVKCKLGMHDWDFIQSRLLPRGRPGVRVMQKYYICRSCGREKGQRTCYQVRGEAPSAGNYL